MDHAAVQDGTRPAALTPLLQMAEHCSAPSGDGDDTNAQRAKRRRAAPNPSTQAIDAADLRLLESLPRELGLRDFRFLARGHKGVVYVAEGAAGRVAIKVSRGSGEETACRREARWLARCNKDLWWEGCGPKLISAHDECVVMEYVEGPSIGEALDGAVPADVLFRALLNLLAQCAELDKEGIDKREMNRCQKHVIVGPSQRHTCTPPGMSTLLDFERCQESPKPSNVTGLAQYLTQAWAVGKLRGAGASVDIDAVRAACKRHKKEPSPETVAAVEEALGLKAALRRVRPPWRCEVDAAGRASFTNGRERRDTWPRPDSPGLCSAKRWQELCDAAGPGWSPWWKPEYRLRDRPANSGTARWVHADEDGRPVDGICYL